MVGRPAPWVALGVVLTLALRAPWLHAALGRDEGGVALIARAWHHSRPYPYGSYFLDRPPLLVALYRWALVLDGATGIRILGALAAVATVVLATLLAVRVGGSAAGPWAALLSGLLASAFAIDAVFTPAELLAIVPSAASLLALVAGIQRRDGGRWALAAAGALAVAAFLVKQSYIDALVAGAAGLAVAVRRAPWRLSLSRAAAYAVGAGSVVAGVLVWERIAHTPDDSVTYALFGFRLDAVHALTSAPLLTRLGHLGQPVLLSGLAGGVVCAAVGIAALRRQPAVCAALYAWLLAGIAGVVGGGSYWAHYLIELVPVTAVGAAVAMARRPRAGVPALFLVAAPVLAATAVAIHVGQPRHYQASALAVGRYLHARAEPHQTAYVRYAKVNILYYSGLQSPVPYEWSLMVEAVPGAQDTLEDVLESPRRPTWVVEWQGDRAFGMDRSGVLRRLLTRDYRRVATVCGRPVLLARGARARPAPPGATRCTARPVVA